MRWLGWYGALAGAATLAWIAWGLRTYERVEWRGRTLWTRPN